MNNTIYVDTSQQGIPVNQKIIYLIPVNQKIIYLISESVIWQKCYATVLETFRVGVIYY